MPEGTVAVGPHSSRDAHASVAPGGPGPAQQVRYVFCPLPPSPQPQAQHLPYAGWVLVLQHLAETQLSFLYQPSDFLADVSNLAHALGTPELHTHGRILIAQAGLASQDSPDSHGPWPEYVVRQRLHIRPLQHRTGPWDALFARRTALAMYGSPQAWLARKLAWKPLAQMARPHQALLLAMAARCYKAIRADARQHRHLLIGCPDQMDLLQLYCAQYAAPHTLYGLLKAVEFAAGLFRRELSPVLATWVLDHVATAPDQEQAAWAALLPQKQLGRLQSLLPPCMHAALYSAYTMGPPAADSARSIPSVDMCAAKPSHTYASRARRYKPSASRTATNPPCSSDSTTSDSTLSLLPSSSNDSRGHTIHCAATAPAVCDLQTHSTRQGTELGTQPASPAALQAQAAAAVAPTGICGAVAPPAKHASKAQQRGGHWQPARLSRQHHRQQGQHGRLAPPIAWDCLSRADMVGSKFSFMPQPMAWQLASWILHGIPRPPTAQLQEQLEEWMCEELAVVGCSQAQQHAFFHLCRACRKGGHTFQWLQQLWVLHKELHKCKLQPIWNLTACNLQHVHSTQHAWRSEHLPDQQAWQRWLHDQQGLSGGSGSSKRCREFGPSLAAGVLAIMQRNLKLGVLLAEQGLQPGHRTVSAIETAAVLKGLGPIDEVAAASAKMHFLHTHTHYPEYLSTMHQACRLPGAFAAGIRFRPETHHSVAEQAAVHTYQGILRLPEPLQRHNKVAAREAHRTVLAARDLLVQWKKKPCARCWCWTNELHTPSGLCFECWHKRSPARSVSGVQQAERLQD